MLNSEQMTELVDIREQFVNQFFSKRIDTLHIEEIVALSNEKVCDIVNQGYIEFRRRYPELNNEFVPHLPHHALRE